MTMKVEPPASLSRAEKRTFRRLVTQLVEAQIEPAAREALLSDYVQLDARIAALRDEENEALDPKARMAASRALNVASAERRRLHGALFKGARKRPAPPPDDERISPEQEAADQAWGAFYRGNKSISETELRARYGSPSWRALLELSAERYHAHQARTAKAK